MNTVVPNQPLTSIHAEAHTHHIGGIDQFPEPIIVTVHAI
jgi:hypothetical protein